jgi:hypothetical protein
MQFDIFSESCVVFIRTALAFFRCGRFHYSLCSPLSARFTARRFHTERQCAFLRACFATFASIRSISYGTDFVAFVRREGIRLSLWPGRIQAIRNEPEDMPKTTPLQPARGQRNQDGGGQMWCPPCRAVLHRARTRNVT